MFARTSAARCGAMCFSTIVLALAALAAAGCAGHYITPGGPANFRALGITAEEAQANTDNEIALRMNRKPAASFPAAIAIARVQDRGYSSYSASGYGRGKYTILTSRDAEAEVDLARLAQLPGTRGLAPINRFIAPPDINTEYDIRLAAADVQADILLLYTLDTGFVLRDKTIPALGTLTLGLFNERSRITSTASAAFIDTRTGFIYGLAEASATASSVDNAWNSQNATDRARHKAESQAFEKLVTELETCWQGIVAKYGASAPAGVPG